MNCLIYLSVVPLRMGFPDDLCGFPREFELTLVLGYLDDLGAIVVGSIVVPEGLLPYS